MKNPEWWLVVVAAITGFVIAWQAWETKRAVEVGRDSAKAAQDNIELIIAKERARLVFDLKELNLVPDPEFGFYAVNFTVAIIGPTAAFDIETKCAAYVDREESMDEEDTSEAVMFPMPFLPKIILSGSDAIRGFAIFEDETGKFGEEVMAEIKAQRLFVGIRGYIQYKDIFERHRVTAFRYRWKESVIPGMSGDWIQCGKPDENQST